MAIKNYTSTVEATTTIARIESLLARHGATGIAKEYANSQVTGIMFQIPNPITKDSISVKLPVNIQAAYAALKKDVKNWDLRKEPRFREQAIRTAWKLNQDWLEVQLSLITMQQVDLLQVFLPYIWNGKQSYYALVKESKSFLALPAPKQE